MNIMTRTLVVVVAICAMLLAPLIDDINGIAMLPLLIGIPFIAKLLN